MPVTFLSFSDCPKGTDLTPFHHRLRAAMRVELFLDAMEELVDEGPHSGQCVEGMLPAPVIGNVFFHPVPPNAQLMLNRHGCSVFPGKHYLFSYSGWQTLT